MGLLFGASLHPSALSHVRLQLGPPSSIPSFLHRPSLPCSFGAPSSYSVPPQFTSFFPLPRLLFFFKTMCFFCYSFPIDQIRSKQFCSPQILTCGCIIFLLYIFAFNCQAATSNKITKSSRLVAKSRADFSNILIATCTINNLEYIFSFELMTPKYD